MNKIDISKETIDWLLSGPLWMQYKLRTDLLDLKTESSDAFFYKSDIFKDEGIKKIISDLACWPGRPLSSHKSADHLIHRLVFLSETGADVSESNIASIARKVLANKSPEGVLQSFIRIPEYFGGQKTGKWTWMLCDAPLLVYSMCKLGMGENKDVIKSASYLFRLADDNGYRCITSSDLKFRGPGRKGDPCPYSTLIMLKMMSQYKKYKDTDECKNSIECILSLWEKSEELHPYMFYMGTDFRKLKAPTLWYDIVSVLEVLSAYDFLKGDKRIEEMLDILISYSDKDGRFTPGSVYTKLSGWEFAQKKQPSAWLTFLIYRILKRFDKINNL